MVDLVILREVTTKEDICNRDNQQLQDKIHIPIMVQYNHGMEDVIMYHVLQISAILGNNWGNPGSPIPLLGTIYRVDRWGYVHAILFIERTSYSSLYSVSLFGYFRWISQMDRLDVQK
jgi:hypothetical protein